MSAKGASSHSAAVNEVREKILHDHNKYRKIHHVPPLQLNDKLNAIAQNWADYLLSTRVLKHRPQTKLGENLWTGSGFRIEDLLTNEKANPVRSWYSEITNYPTASFEKWGHFTQLIWKGSKYLGCGISYDEETIFVVCNYDPPGNWRNKYHENVFTVEGAPWSDKVQENESTDEDSKRSGGRVRGRGGGEGGADDDESAEADGGEPVFISEEREEAPTPYWIYGVAFAIIILVVIVLAALIYSQKS